MVRLFRLHEEGRKDRSTNRTERPARRSKTRSAVIRLRRASETPGCGRGAHETGL